MPEHKERQKYYERVFNIFKKRPDLQVSLRIKQCADLALEKEAISALNIGMQTCIEHAEMSRLILPLVKQCVEITKAYNLQEKAKPFFDKVHAKFPKKRGNDVSKAYLQFQSYLDSIYK